MSRHFKPAPRSKIAYAVNSYSDSIARLQAPGPARKCSKKRVRHANTVPVWKYTRYLQVKHPLLMRLPGEIQGSLEVLCSSRLRNNVTNRLKSYLAGFARKHPFLHSELRRSITHAISDNYEIAPAPELLDVGLASLLSGIMVFASVSGCYSAQVQDSIYEIMIHYIDTTIGNATPMGVPELVGVVQSSNNSTLEDMLASELVSAAPSAVPLAMPKTRGASGFDMAIVDDIGDMRYNELAGPVRPCWDIIRLDGRETVGDDGREYVEAKLTLVGDIPPAHTEFDASGASDTVGYVLLIGGALCSYIDGKFVWDDMGLRLPAGQVPEPPLMFVRGNQIFVRMLKSQLNGNVLAAGIAYEHGNYGALVDSVGRLVGAGIEHYEYGAVSQEFVPVIEFGTNVTVTQLANITAKQGKDWFFGRDIITHGMIVAKVGVKKIGSTLLSGLSRLSEEFLPDYANIFNMISKRYNQLNMYVLLGNTEIDGKICANEHIAPAVFFMDMSGDRPADILLGEVIDARAVFEKHPTKHTGWLEPKDWTEGVGWMKSRPTPSFVPFGDLLAHGLGGNGGRVDTEFLVSEVEIDDEGAYLKHIYVDKNEITGEEKVASIRAQLQGDKIPSRGSHVLVRGTVAEDAHGEYIRADGVDLLVGSYQTTPRGELMPDTVIAEANCPVDIVAVDSSGRTIDMLLPNVIYSGTDAEPEWLAIIDPQNDVSFKVKSDGSGAGYYSLNITKLSRDGLRRISLPPERHAGDAAVYWYRPHWSSNHGAYADLYIDSNGDGKPESAYRITNDTRQPIQLSDQAEVHSTLLRFFDSPLWLAAIAGGIGAGAAVFVRKKRVHKHARR